MHLFMQEEILQVRITRRSSYIYTYTCMYTCIYIHIWVTSRVNIYIHVYIYVFRYIYMSHISCARVMSSGATTR